MANTIGAPARWAGFIDALLDPVWMVELGALHIVAANAAAARLFGVPASGLLGRDMRELAATPADEAQWADVQAAPAEHGPHDSQPMDSWVQSLDGQMHPVTLRISVLAHGPGAGHALVSARPRDTEVALREELDRRVGELQATLESTTDGILVTELSGAVQRFNRRFAELWALPASLLVQRDDAALKAWLRGRVVEPGVWARVQEHWLAGPAQAVVELVQLVDGTLLECVSHPLMGAGATLGRVTSFRDLSERQRAQREIDRLQSTDGLTGLANRRAFSERLALRLAEQQARLRGAAGAGGAPARGVALLQLGLDRFRTINETLGAPAGDEVLVETARRLEACLTRSDLLGRVGGDEFAIGLADTDMRGAEAVARRLLGALASPFLRDGTRFTLTGSVGITLLHEGSADVDGALQQADAAMRRAKEAGRATFRFHQARHNVDLRERLRIDHAMREGLPAGHFRVHVQPQVNLRDGELVGVEALLRWTDPVLGEMAPSRFIAQAEDSGFIVELGQWVLDQATAIAALWLREGRSVPIAVNVSALQFRQPDFVDRVAQALDRSGLPAALLELELTESILVDDAADAQRRLGELARLGVRLSLDDFGTGYSSLSYLKDLPLHRLKIDRSFVTPLPEACRQAAIVQAVVHMAGALGLEVVAEGVETAAQADFLRSAGCALAQGYLFGRPMEPAHLAALFQEGMPPRLEPPARLESTATRPAPLGHGSGNGNGNSRTVRRGAGRGLTLVKA